MWRGRIGINRIKIKSLAFAGDHIGDQLSRRQPRRKNDSFGLTDPAIGLPIDDDASFNRIGAEIENLNRGGSKRPS